LVWAQSADWDISAQVGHFRAGGTFRPRWDISAHPRPFRQPATSPHSRTAAAHFLAPYCPELNPIERVCLGLHAAVTRNHRCATIDELMTEVHDYLKYRNRTQSRTQPQAVA